MPEQQLQDYIIRNRQTGSSDEQIRQALLGSGWSEDDINQALTSVGSQVGSDQTPVEYALPSAWDLFKQAIFFYRSKLKVVVGIMAIPLAVDLAAILTDVFLGSQDSVLSMILVAVLMIMGLVATVLSTVAMFSAVTDIQNATVTGSYRKGLTTLVGFAWVSFLTSISSLGGFFLLFIPGIVVSIYLSQSAYVFYVEGKRGMSALVRSWYYVKGRGGRVFWRSLFFGLVMMLIILPMGLLASFMTPDSYMSPSAVVETVDEISSQQPSSPILQSLNYILNNLIIAPLGVIYFYLLFTSLKATKTGTLDEEQERKIHKKLKVLVVVSAVGVVLLTLLAGTAIIRIYNYTQDISLFFVSPLLSSISSTLISR